jgi:hypothetical protein
MNISKASLLVKNINQRTKQDAVIRYFGWWYNRNDL